MSHELIDEVLDFINRRFCNFPKEYWNTGNCYYFAIILCSRFPELKPYYDPIEGHFWAGNGEWFFDKGSVQAKECFNTIISLEDIKNNDPLWYERLMEDCVK